ncbi:MAG: DUF192 domain-containing protein [Spirochaetales bacterium]|nr:DUF192 domain-containing protein [Spirochaetales bacterium]
MKASTVALILFAALSLGACEGDDALRTVTLRSGSVELVAELAITPEEQQQGLMFREELPDGRGMLFVYGSDRRMAFWMKNTKIPLSIAFLAADGTIREIRDMRPESLEVIESARSARHALEVPQGWFARVGLAVGDRFELPPDLRAP